MDIYLVGGAVRDKLLAYPWHDSDWVVVGATPEQLLAKGYQPVGKDFPVFLHPESKEEYALARTERKTGRGYKGFECYSSPDVTLEEDLLRRDLTINAIAEDSEGSLIDPYGGQQDIEKKLLRHTSPAFSEDPLRVLRTARFYARYAHLGFQIADETLELIKKIADSGELKTLVAERCWREIERALTEKNPSCFFSALIKTGALTQLIPEFAPTDQTLDTNTLALLDEAAAQGQSSLIRFALLFQKTNKQQAEKICQRIKAPNEFRHLALLISSYSKEFSTLENNHQAQDWLTMLQQTDAFRRPQRFEDFLVCSELLFKQPRICNTLKQALAACNDIDVARLAATGLKGPAIAEALQQQRLDAISQLLEKA